jgi:hypothetical protein
LKKIAVKFFFEMEVNPQIDKKKENVRRTEINSTKLFFSQGQKSNLKLFLTQVKILAKRKIP